MSKRVTVPENQITVTVYDPPNSVWLRAHSPLGRAHAEEVMRDVIVVGRGGDPDTATFHWQDDDMVQIIWASGDTP